jgi:serine/threonine protein kinase
MTKFLATAHRTQQPPTIQQRALVRSIQVRTFDLLELLQMARRKRVTIRYNTLLYLIRRFYQVCHPLWHDYGLLLNDLRLENIVFSQNLQITSLRNFGHWTPFHTFLTYKVNSGQYQAPEMNQVPLVRYSTTASEGFAFGVCLFNMIFQTQPFSK